jgi:CHASE1-domain containing sensor protein
MKCRTVLLLLQTYHYLIVSTAIVLAVSTMGLCSLVSGHTMEEVKKAFEGEVSDPLVKITRAYEQNVDGAFRAQLHATQHEMMLDAKQTILKLQCIELLKKLPALEREVRRLEKEGRAEKAERLQLKIDEGRAAATIACPTPARQ